MEFTYKGYKIKKEQNLMELLEADIISSEEFGVLREHLNGISEPIKKRVDWKKKYQQEVEESKYWYNKYNELLNKVLGEK